MQQSIYSGKSIQEIAKERAREENREIRTVREAHIMMFLKHPNIVRMRDIISQGSYFYILMDYVEGTQLLHYIVKRQRLSERRTKHFTRQIVSALDYLHRNSIVHRDLKIENIMVDKSGKHIKIIDFGLSNLFCPERQLTTYCGSLYFAAPELLRAIPYNGPEVDIWSLGIVIYVMLTGSVPFDARSMPELHEKIKRGHVNYPYYLDDSCKDLLSRIFITDPTHRIIMNDIIHHPWLIQDLGLINNYMPPRKLLTLPLNPKVIERISVGFNLGTPEEIERRLTLILQSPVYHEAISYINECHLQKQLHPPSSTGYYPIVYDDPQSIPGAYHPLISLYYLAAEKLITIEHEKHQKRMSIRSSSLSRTGSIDSLGGYSSARSSSQASLVDEFNGVRLFSDVPPLCNINNHHMEGMPFEFEPSHSTNYLTRIQHWLRSSLSQHHLASVDQSSPSPPPPPRHHPIDDSREKQRFHIVRSHSLNSHPHRHSMISQPSSPPPTPPHHGKSLFRKISHAFLRKNSLKGMKKTTHEEMKRYSMPPHRMMDVYTSNQSTHRHYEPNTISPSMPTISRSASLASASFQRNRRGSISTLTDKMNTWLALNQLNTTTTTEI